MNTRDQKAQQAIIVKNNMRQQLQADMMLRNIHRQLVRSESHCPVHTAALTDIVAQKNEQDWRRNSKLCCPNKEQEVRLKVSTF